MQEHLFTDADKTAIASWLDYWEESYNAYLATLTKTRDESMWDSKAHERYKAHMILAFLDLQKQRLESMA